jgi:hypothetical protein
LDGPGRARIRIEKWDAEDKKFSADVTEPTQLVLRLFNYPAWQVQVNGRPVETKTHDTTGQIIVPVKAGSNEVTVHFARTWDRITGGWVSIVTAVVVFAVWLLINKSNPPATFLL